MLTTGGWQSLPVWVATLPVLVADLSVLVATLDRFTHATICRNCRHYGVCTTSQRGRAIIRLIEEETKVKLERYYRTPEAQEVYALRKQKVELPFGHMKRNLGVTSFLLRGLRGVNAEMSLLGTCFNIARMITLLGVGPLSSGLCC